ncbi:MAG: redox-sensing transcriptional repressor Rex [Verrucomicrobiae bacterium]|nr:redox-sensing transcriptional repressor Rex [Verrucomicrobiae bacterium]
MKQVIPRKAVYRLSVFLRCLHRLEENQVETVSSEALAKAAGVKSSQLRKDLAYFGQFGMKGVGYNVKELSEKITKLLGTNKLQPVILVGVGDLGSALLTYRGFQKEGFEVLAGFDADPRRKRSKIFDVPILPMEDILAFVQKHDIKMAILAVPAAVAQAVANQLITHGIEAILNFAPIMLEVPENCVVNNVNLAMELENLSYFIK